MKMLNTFIIILVLNVLSASCGSKKPKLLYEGEDYLSEQSENHSDLLSEEMVTESDNNKEMPTESTASNNGPQEFSQDLENKDLIAIENNEPNNGYNNKDSFDSEGSIDFYSVEKNDTLMMIAFKIYGDITKWKSILEMNPDKLKKGYPMAGQMLAYTKPKQQFSHIPRGNPVLVLEGDSLGLISHNIYDRASWWVHIYENNKLLIRNPDQIYAGFTLYTLTKKEILNRGLASE